MMGRREEGGALFEPLLALRNDSGLLSEGYNTRKRNMLGNFPRL
jgi:GH15 family glucan-1,4-alpha-glucosidase